MLGTAAVLLLALVAAVAIAPAHAAHVRQVAKSSTSTSATAFNCPAHCHCSNRTTTLHYNGLPTPGEYSVAVCSSLNGLAQYATPAAIQVLSVTRDRLQHLGLHHELDRFTNLSALALENCRLSEVPRLTNATHLLAAHLSHNHIKVARFARLPPSVQFVNVTHNGIRELNASDFAPLLRLQRLALAGNPINCSCETLHTLGWLQAERHVRLDEVRCATPLLVKGALWERARTRIECPQRQRGRRQHPEVNVNELDSDEQMLADGPVFANEDASVLAADEFERDFIPLVPSKRVLKRQLEPEADNDAIDASGEDDDGPVDEAVNVATERVLDVAASARAALDDGSNAAPAKEDEDEDGSGDDEGPAFSARLHDDASANSTEAATDAEAEHDDDDGASGDDDGFPIPSLFDAGNDTDTDHDDSTTLLPATVDVDEHIDENFTPKTLNIFGTNEITHPSVVDSNDGAVGDASASDDDGPLEEETQKPTGRLATGDTHPHKVTAAEKETAESTYIVLVMLAILLLGLIVFVAIRRKNAARRRRNGGGGGGEYDTERGAKEMTVMNGGGRSGTQLGASGNGSGNGNNGNGVEVLPLIGARDKWDSRIQPAHGLTKPDQEELRLAQQPLLQRRGADPPQVHGAFAAAGGSRPESRASQTNEERPQTPGSEGSEAAGEKNNNEQDATTTGGDHDETEAPSAPAAAATPTTAAYLPLSPKPARYSPVYSPETGRVKIKLAETPRPRTPMLVQRSRSNAGEIVSTPLRPPK